jgi:hypothetical protein
VVGVQGSDVVVGLLVAILALAVLAQQQHKNSKMLNICCYGAENNNDAVGSLSSIALPGPGTLAQNLY